jgi:hypothetical protein
VTHAVGDAVSVVELVTAGERPPELRPLSGLSPAYRNTVDVAIGGSTPHPTASLAFAAALNESGTRLFVPHLAVQNGQEAVTVVPAGYGGVSVEEDTTVASVAVLAVESGEWVAPPKPRVPSARCPRWSPRACAVPATDGRERLGDALYVTSYGTGELVELDARSLDRAMAPRRTFASVTVRPASTSIR